MKLILKYFPIILFAALVLAVFRAWFMPGLISAGDLWPFYKSMYAIRPLSLYAWDWSQGAGMGGFSGALLWIYLDFGIPLTILGKALGLGWESIERIYFMYPFLILSFFSSYLMFKKIFGKSNFSILSAAIFTLNTYSLMLVGGGQFGVVLAYSISPIVLLSFISVIDSARFTKRNLQLSILSGLAVSLQILLDLRIAYITLVVVLIYWLIRFVINRNVRELSFSFLFTFIIPEIISAFLNAFWILPTLANRQNPIAELGAAYSSLAAVKFFSFAKLENTIGLLHPNWPENIFGKVNFMQPEFLLLPILAFAALFFVKRNQNTKEKTYILFFALLGIIGTFLAKGANDPFGAVYLWLFSHFPGFMMFRDPTKWYTLVAISYSMLIPFAIWKIFSRLESLRKFQKFQLSKLFLLVVAACLLFMIKPAILGQLNGTFKATQIPGEYVRLADFLSAQDSFSRTLWVPTEQRFAFYNSQHPTVPAQDLFSLYNNEQIFQKLKQTNTENSLQELGIKYVIIPYDSQGEIFLSDRKYDGKAYQKLISEMKTIGWLKPVNGFGRIAVFEVPNAQGHFWTTSKTISLDYESVSPVEYVVNVRNAQKGDLVVFAENYDKSWLAKNSLFVVHSSKFENRFNSFILPASGDYRIEVYYSLQNAVYMGEIISGIALIVAVSILGLLFLRKT